MTIAGDAGSTFRLGQRGRVLDTAKDVHGIVDAIRTMRSLNEVFLAGNIIGLEAGNAIADVLKLKPSLQVSLFPWIETC